MRSGGVFKWPVALDAVKFLLAVEFPMLMTLWDSSTVLAEMARRVLSAWLLLSMFCLQSIDFYKSFACNQVWRFYGQHVSVHTQLYYSFRVGTIIYMS